MTLDVRHHRGGRPDKQLLTRLESRKRAPSASPIPPRSPALPPAPHRYPRPSQTPPAPRAVSPSTPTPARAKAFLSEVQTKPGIGMPSAARARQVEFVHPWNDHKPAPPLPAFAVEAIRAAVRLRQPHALPRHAEALTPAQTFSAAELAFFDAGDELANVLPYEEDEDEETGRRWWQRLPAPGSTNH